MIKTLIDQFQEEFDLGENLTNPSPNQYSLTFKEDRILTAFDSNHSIYLRGIIGPLDRNKLDETLSKAMEMNLFGKKTRGAVIGLDQNQWVLTLELPNSISYSQFKEAMENFLNDLDKLSLELK